MADYHTCSSNNWSLRDGTWRDCPDCNKPAGRVTNWGMDREELHRVDL